MGELSSWLDYAILAIIVLSTLISLIRGFVREALSLVTWATAFWLAITFNPSLSQYLQATIQQAELRTAASFGILFVGTLLVGGIINFMLGSLMQRVGLSGTDRMLGMLFGLGRGILLVALLLSLGSFTSLAQHEQWKSSRLVSYFTPLEQWMRQFMPDFKTEPLNLPMNKFNAN